MPQTRQCATYICSCCLRAAYAILTRSPELGAPHVAFIIAAIHILRRQADDERWLLADMYTVDMPGTRDAADVTCFSLCLG